MPKTPWDRRELLRTISAGAATGFLIGGGHHAAAQQVKWSEGTEPPKLKAPPNACDCHHHIYDARYPVDPKAVLRPGDALVEDYRAFQKRIGTSRNVVVTPSTYGVDNRVTLDAVAAFGPQARAVVVVNDTVSDADLKRMHGQGARGIRFNFAPAGATTPEMIEPLSKRVNELGWHIQINAPAAKIIEIMPILEKVPTPIVFDHLAHIPEPEGVNHPLFGQVRALIDKGKPGSNCRAPTPTQRLGHRPMPTRPRLRRRMRRLLRSGAYGAATGRTPLNARRSQTTLCCLISSSYGRPTRRSAT